MLKLSYWPIYLVCLMFLVSISMIFYLLGYFWFIGIFCVAQMMAEGSAMVYFIIPAIFFSPIYTWFLVRNILSGYKDAINTIKNLLSVANAR